MKLNRHIIRIFLILVPNSIKNVYCQQPLKCYICNSYHKQCDETNFDPVIQKTSFCYGDCMKISVSPGEFIIRSCSTFNENSRFIKNLTLAEGFVTNQCYLAKYEDPSNLSIREAYVCYCNDRTGCNNSNSLFNQYTEMKD
ncbi:hypothetical protein BpHYR1_007810 [Brachionus plicatilis]|uniref:Protein quiver n=1 Tax=Brachionus plicatilis TaxID=10195 RepID=A0A3M7QHJ9_BRAPC|nr:hypothetical protein BpHYR1_007810 [Brachionus plicatilis]